MRNRSFILLFTLLSIGNLIGSERYDKIRIWTDDTRQTISELAPLGIDMEGLDIRRDVYLDLQLSLSEKNQVIEAGFSTEDLIIDLSDFYAERLSQQPLREFGQGSMGGYYTLSEIIENMDSLHAQYPHIVSAKDSIGTSFEGRTIWAFKISDNPEVDEDEPEVFYNSLIHAREPAAMMTVLYFAWELAENYTIENLSTYLVDGREIWFLPVVNPDGYAYNEWLNPNGGGMHRKNMRPVCTSDPGIDLNRNWGYQWGFDNIGSSIDPCGATYRGDEAFSEPETQVVRDFIMDHDFSTIFNYHSYGNLLIRPFGYQDDTPLFGDDEALYEALGNDLVRDNQYLFGTGLETVNYTTNGDAVDYQYGELGIINFTPEVGTWSQGGFWPPGDLVFDLARENLSMNVHLAGVAGSWIRLQDLTLENQGNLEPGMAIAAELTLKNQGLSTSEESVILTLSSPDSSILITQEAFDIIGLEPQATYALGPEELSFNISPAAVSSATLVVTLEVAGAYTLQDTFTWNVGYADTIWTETFEAGMGLWESTSWDLDYSAYAGQYSMSESPQGEYPELSTLTVTLIDGIDLRGYSSASLSFMAKWDIEIDYDFCQILASDDAGETWRALPGDYTALGNGATVQPVGEPGYHGTQDWVQDQMNLDDYAGSPDLLLRLQVLSDTYYEGDGFRIDNMEISAWGIGFFPGDITRDGLVTISDVVLALDWIIQDETPAGDSLELADINEDGVLNVLDLILMIERVLVD